MDIFDEDLFAVHVNLRFYEPCVFDPTGGFFQYFLNDDCIYDADTANQATSNRALT